MNDRTKREMNIPLNVKGTTRFINFTTELT